MTSADHQPPTVFQGTVRKPDQDNKAYQIITLDNGLQAIVISDPRTDKAAAALDIHIGHLCDPDEVAGLAHFCEHLIQVKTNILSFFHSTADIPMHSLEQRIPKVRLIVSQFFIAPLFSDSCTERELNAVDSEHKKNLQNDTWRNYQLEKDLSNPNHPFVKFGTGNMETIRDIPTAKGLDIRKVLLDFHEKYYSANIMKVAVLGAEIRVKPVKTRRLSLIFPFLTPERCIRVRVGTVLSAGTGGFGARGFEFMRISIQEQSPPSSYVSGLAGDLQTYQPSDVISGPYLLEHLDRDAIKANFDTYSPESFRLADSRHYGTKYIVKDFSASLVQKVAVEKPSTHPMIILESPVLRLWHKQDDTFFVPRVNIYFDMTTPLAYQDATSCVLSKLFTDLFKDSLNEFSYYAEVAGLHYRFDNTVDGLMLSLHGYNDKMHILLDKIAEKMVTYVTNDQQFDRIKKQLAKSYRNLDIEAPESHAIYRVNQITQGRLFTHEEKLQALEPLTSADVQTFFPKLFERMHIQQLAHGNISKQRAIDIGNILLSRLNPKALPESQRLQSMLTKQIPEGSSYIHIRDVPNAENVNSAIEYILQVGSLSDQYIRTHLSILSQIGHEPVFDQLRTKEQLGYMVYSGIRKQPEMLSYRIIIQSERDPAYLESRIVAFLHQLERISKHQTSIATKMLDTLKNLGQESSRYWGHINSLYYDFEQHITDAEQIHRITKDQLIAFYRKHISPDSKNAA
ncbi:hypothetical protein BSLG_007997 [Batrachochytrium salamandrivorans]|nr:hypothetical protein BSLG_007997 [Batrachochytrium salamandrivorans]